MRNLVTGATGFLGSHLAEALLARGEYVRALVRPGSDTRLLEQWGLDLVVGSLGDCASLVEATTGIERVYHCAALAADWGEWAAFESANVDGVRNLLEASLHNDIVKFIHVSTTDVYGHPGRRADEQCPYRLRGWPYGDSKVRGEQLVWDYHRRHALPVTVIRPPSIYGPRSATFVGEIIDLLQRGLMPHIGPGEKPAGLAYVANVVDLMLLAAEADDSTGEAYNAGDGSMVSWRTYVNRLADLIGAARPRITIPHAVAYSLGWAMEKSYGLMGIRHRPLLTRMAVELFGTAQDFPVDKARDTLGYRPRVDFQCGMQKVDDWLQRTRAC